VNFAICMNFAIANSMQRLGIDATYRFNSIDVSLYEQSLLGSLN